MPGYINDFVRDPEERFLCNICTDVMHNPVETGCGHNYCRDCLDEALRWQPVCPTCREAVDDGDIHHLMGVAREIQNLVVHCPNKDKGCFHTATLQHIDDHINNCTVHLLPTQPDNDCDAPPSREGADGRSLSPDPINAQSLQSPDITAAGEETNQAHSLRKWGLFFSHFIALPPAQRRQSRAFFCCSTQPCDGWSLKRCLIAAAVFLLALVVVAACSYVFVIVFAPPHMSVLNKTCPTTGKSCTDDSGLRMSCDLLNHTCLLQPDEICRGENKDLCVSDATCDQKSQRCTCNEGFSELGHVCALKRGDFCSGGNEHLCWTGEYCDIYDTQQCQCLDHYHPSGDFCLLKAEVTGVDCTTVTPCVERARCDRDTGRCLCDEDYSVRWDGLCGLHPFVNVSSCDGVVCYSDHDDLVCMVTGVASAQCQCPASFHWDFKTEKCALRLGEYCSGANEHLCWTGEYCDIYDTQQCQCLDHFQPSGDFCLLKAEVFGVDCTAVTPCVEHAKCDRKTGQCLCDKDYSVRWDGLCGLRPSVTVPSCNGVMCYSNLVCVETGINSAQCKCSASFSWDTEHDKCEFSGGMWLKPSWLAFLSTPLLFVALAPYEY